MGLFKTLFGSRNDRMVKNLQKRVVLVNQFEASMQALSDIELRQKTEQFKQRVVDGETLDHLLPEAFAVMREASSRVFGMRHFDVQLIGGMVMHAGNIAEMRTGEGKTLAATLPAYLNALSEEGVHIVTVNDYLARRDAEWMRPVYEFLGLTVGVNVHDLTREEKRAAYACDILYGTNNEYGFDYLRDNMAFSPEQKVQRQLNFAIVDEVDSILIDEARTPLIISGAADDSSELYKKLNELVPRLQHQVDEEGEGDYTIDEKVRQVYLTEQGHQTIEEWLLQQGLMQADESLYDLSNISLVHHAMACLRAHAIYQKDVDYIVRDGQVLIVDEHTGRTLSGRRWSDGLHQAVEAKEGVTIQAENQTLATITFQNYFRLYQTLSGMTGTADTEAYEFQQIYGLEVIVIPTHKPMVRQDHADLVYLTTGEKYAEIINDIKARREQGQPILVGTVSIESSEYLDQLLSQENIPHKVLNAKFHAQEAEIIAEAGRPGAVTIATNMAGRGTDIVLGGNLEAELAVVTDQQERERLTTDWQQRHQQVLTAGGLHIIGTERHESRRIDNQLRGRAGRQGDPGSSRFYLSLEDNLMRIFASDRVAGLMEKLGLGQGEPIEHSWVTKAIENAQRKVEGFNFDIRKQLLEYDDIANEQRKVVYAQRAEIMAGEDIKAMLVSIRRESVETLVAEFMPPDSFEQQWDIDQLVVALRDKYGLEMPVQQWLEQDNQLDHAAVVERTLSAMILAYEEKEAIVGVEVMRDLEKSIILQTLDNHWKEHLANMDYLRQGIHLRGYAQKNPKQEYKRESFKLFTHMKTMIKQDVAVLLAQVRVQSESEIAAFEQQRQRAAAQRQQDLRFQHASAPALADGDDDEEPKPAQRAERSEAKVGRNDSCPCRSGKKFKHCCGQLS